MRYYVNETANGTIHEGNHGGNADQRHGAFTTTAEATLVARNLVLNRIHACGARGVGEQGAPSVYCH